MYDTTWAAYQNKAMKFANLIQVECWTKSRKQKTELASWATNLEISREFNHFGKKATR